MPFIDSHYRSKSCPPITDCADSASNPLPTDTSTQSDTGLTGAPTLTVPTGNRGAEEMAQEVPDEPNATLDDVVSPPEGEVSHVLTIPSKDRKGKGKSKDSVADEEDASFTEADLEDDDSNLNQDEDDNRTIEYDPATDDVEEHIEKIYAAWFKRFSDSTKSLGKRLADTKV
jgi:hypothetical protein